MTDESELKPNKPPARSSRRCPKSGRLTSALFVSGLLLLSATVVANEERHEVEDAEPRHEVESAEPRTSDVDEEKRHEVLDADQRREVEDAETREER